MAVDDPRSAAADAGPAMDPADFCRQVEGYLCRKNDGHLVRIVGPAFEQVCGWAQRGIPLKVVCRGVDRFFDRYYAKGPRRRPIRIEFCEADVMDVFDEWRRAVGIGLASGAAAGAEEDGGDGGSRTRKESLPAHLERVIVRLTALRSGGDRSLDPLLEALVAELDGLRARAKGLRGDARAQVVDRLRALDEQLLEAAHARLDAAAAAALAREADTELAPFRARMPQDAYAQAHRACVARLLRERIALPVIALE